MADGEGFRPGPVEFELVLPTTDEFLLENVAWTRAQGLKGADSRKMHLNVIANGPSAGGANFNGMSMALNGAINLFPKGKPPTFWCVSDPQAPKPGVNMPVDFLKGKLPRKTTYYVASKCHRSVFERLNIGQPWWKFWRRPYNVQTWHISDTEHAEGERVIPCATSVTLTALILAQRLGFRTVDVWGWDCCFGENGAHHAAYSELGSTAQTVDVRVGGDDWGKHFKTTPTWALEAKEAVQILTLLRWAGVDVKIHGDGMVRAIAAEFAEAPLFPPPEPLEGI
jgi:hypothetical protein